MSQPSSLALFDGTITTGQTITATTFKSPFKRCAFYYVIDSLHGLTSITIQIWHPLGTGADAYQVTTLNANAVGTVTQIASLVTGTDIDSCFVKLIANGAASSPAPVRVYMAGA